MPRRSNFLAFLALAAPIAIPSVVRAEGRGTPAASGSAASSAPSAPPSASAAPPAPAPSTPAPSTPAPAPSTDSRPPLISPTPSPAPSSYAVPAPAVASPSSVNPARDQQDLAAQGTQRPDTGEISANPREIFSDDWWGRVHPVVELHGYFRTRAELFQNLALGRHGSSLQGNDPQYLAPLPLDQSYNGVSSSGGGGTVQNINLCGAQGNQTCHDSTESGANMRLRLDPEIHISDNLRIVSEIFALDNVVLGSTPDAYAIQPASPATIASSTTTSGTKSPAYQSAGYNPYAPVGFFSTTQGAPTAGVNSLQNSVNVQRVWGEYMTPVGQLRFGRMPGQWGLGMLENSGDGIDSDYQTTLDRIMFITGIKSMDLYFGGAWDYVSTGPTNANAYSVYGGQPYDVCNLCNVNEWAAFVAHRTNPELQRLDLSRGDLVVNGGLYAKFRSQNLDVASPSGTSSSGALPQTPQSLDTSIASNGLETRQAWALTPDLWVQALWRKLRFEAEGAMVYGQIGQLASIPSASVANNNTADIRQFGIVTQTEYRAVEDKLDLQFGFGWSSGDPWAYSTAGGVSQGALSPGPSGPQEANGIGPISTFRFHPDYRVDLLFFRNILSRVEGAYYFRPSVDYDFLRHPNGEKFGGGAAVIWSRASDFVQTPGHKRDLGVELDLQLYYQSKDGSLNDEPGKVGGFYTMLQYGVFFPLGGLDYAPGTTLTNAGDTSLSTAQTVRLFMGIVF
jgi:uncharacterized protein (TIGR04551 family)